MRVGRRLLIAVGRFAETGAKRHRKILRDNIQGITKPAIRRLARRGGGECLVLHRCVSCGSLNDGAQSSVSLA
jgi:histone H3/H4